MSHVLFLTYRMKRGFGVDVEVSNLAAELRKKGLNISIGCMDMDGEYPDSAAFQIAANAATVRRIARKMGVDIIVAHTSPFFEILPDLAADFRVYALEYGDPTPELMSDCEDRRKTKINKLKNVYPHVHGMMSISRFISTDIGWPSAAVVYLGCDHVPDRGVKKASEYRPEQPLKIGALMRLGKGEAEYKGNALLITLFERLKKQIPVDINIMGRGTPADAKDFTAAGYTVLLSKSDDERNDYLRSLDVFVTLSLWEGFNLPLVEAQALGTMSIATDAGAHPEVTPFIISDLAELERLIIAMSGNPKLLAENSNLCYKYVRKKFRWAESAESLLQAIGPDVVSAGKGAQQLGKLTRLRLKFGVVRQVVREQGMGVILWRIIFRIYRKVINRIR